MSQGTETDETAKTAERASETSPDCKSGRDEAAERSLIDLLDVERATTKRLREAEITARDFIEKRVSYYDLVDGGIEPDPADRLRREFSLPWSLAIGDGDLTARSAQIRGLSEDERAWVAASDGDWEAELATKKRVTPPKAVPRTVVESPERRSRPDPVTDVSGIDEPYAERLAAGGITSVRSLAVADPTAVASALDIDRNRVTSWHWHARQLVGAFDFEG